MRVVGVSGEWPMLLIEFLLNDHGAGDTASEGWGRAVDKGAPVVVGVGVGTNNTLF